MKAKFKGLLYRNQWLKFIPNALTLCNSLCGFSAILYTLNVYASPKCDTDVFAVSAWIIIGAMVFDALDGFAARIFNAASMHGLQMDSLSDMVTFGVAPAIMVAVMVNSLANITSLHQFIVWGFCAVYLGCAALRLATYNVHAILEKKSGDKFTGLPTPGAAAAVCSIAIFYKSHTWGMNQLAVILPIYAAVLGILMVSNIPYTHIGRWLPTVRRNRRRLTLLIIVIAGLLISPINTLVLIVNAYIFSGPLGVIAEFISRQCQARRNTNTLNGGV